MLPTIAAAIHEAVNEYGHPDDIPLHSLTGVDRATAEKCFALLTSEELPPKPSAAVAKWIRMIGDSSE